MTPKTLPELLPHEIERFWRSVEKRGENECWPWHGCTSTAHGFTYGLFSIVRPGLRRLVKPHRVSWTLLRRKISDGYTIDHLCFNKLCMNPSHMEEVTQDVNSKRGMVRYWSQRRALNS